MRGFLLLSSLLAILSGELAVTPNLVWRKLVLISNDL